MASNVVDNLGNHVTVGTEYRQAGTLRSTEYVLAHTLVADLAGNSLALAPLESVTHGHLPAFPTLRRTFSPA